MFPAQGGADSTRLKMLAYYSELADLHAEVLSRALRRCTREKRENADFLPTVYQIRRAAALVIRDARIRARGGDPNAAPTHVPFELTDAAAEREIALGPKPGAQLQLSAGA